MVRFILLLASLVLLPAASAQAVGNTYYVSDKLVIGVYQKSSLDGDPLDTLRSGDPVEVISREVNAAKVRTPGGQVVWIDSDYLVADKPDSVQLLVLKDENSRLKAELESMQAELSVSSQQLARARSLSSNDDLDQGYVDPQVVRLMEENMALKTRISAAGDALGVVDFPEVAVDTQMGLSLMWTIIAAAGTLLLGFIFGLLWLDRSIRRRHGGFRI